MLAAVIHSLLVFFSYLYSVPLFPCGVFLLTFLLIAACISLFLILVSLSSAFLQSFTADGLQEVSFSYKLISISTVDFLPANGSSLLLSTVILRVAAVLVFYFFILSISGQFLWYGIFLLLDRCYQYLLSYNFIDGSIFLWISSWTVRIFSYLNYQRLR